MGTLQVAHSDEHGRHLLLARAISLGTPVLKQQPYAAVLYNEEAPRRCDFCFAVSDSLMRCSRSKFAHYCCVAHQKAAWKAYYRNECEALKSCAPNVPPATVRLAGRVLWKKASEQTQQKDVMTVEQRLQLQQQTGGYYSDIEQLESHWDELDASRKVMYAQMAVLTRQYMLGGNTQQPKSPDAPVEDLTIPDVKHIAQLLARFACNNHTICDDELRPIGVGIYPLGALINHSCQPNCAQSFEGPSILFRSLCAMPAGQQVTISYIELAATRQERRRQLLHQYFFDIDASEQQQPPKGHAANAGDSRSPDPRSADVVEPAATAAAVIHASSDDAEAGTQTAQHCCIQRELKLPLLPSIAQQLQHQQQQAVMRDSPSSTLSTSNIHSSIQLSSYPNQSKPPWPEDAPDKRLCQMLLLLHPSSQLTGNSRTKNKALKLPGGMCLLTLLNAGHRAAAGGGATADADATAYMFADLEALSIGDLHSLGFDGEAEHCTGADCGQPQDVQKASPGLADAAAQPGQHSEQQQQHMQQERMEVVQWGDWQGTAATAGNLSSVVSTADLAADAASIMAQLWSLQQQADQLTRRGYAAAAVDVYQKALAAADGSCTASTNSSRYSIALGDMHMMRVRLTAGLLKAAVDHGGIWEVALTAAQALTPQYEAVYPKVWPNLGLHHALTAKLALYLQQPAVAAEAAAAAVDILRVTHSSTSYVLQEVLRVQYEAQQELQASETY